jgi:hypothetical protein
VDQETNKIKRHIDTEREQLVRNLDEIEHRMKSATDLKAHFAKNTGWILGAAVAAGFLLSLAFGKSSTSGSPSSRESDLRASSANIPAQPKDPFSTHVRRVPETAENIISGLVAVVSDKLRSFVADAVPGFREQYEAIERRRGFSAKPQS